MTFQCQWILIDHVNNTRRGEECEENSFVVIVKSFSFKKATQAVRLSSKRSVRLMCTIVVGNSIKNSFILHKYKLSLIMSLLRPGLPSRVCLCVAFTVHLLLFEQGPGREKERNRKKKKKILNSFGFFFLLHREMLRKSRQQGKKWRRRRNKLKMFIFFTSPIVSVLNLWDASQGMCWSVGRLVNLFEEHHTLGEPPVDRTVLLLPRFKTTRSDLPSRYKFARYFIASATHFSIKFQPASIFPCT